MKTIAMALGLTLALGITSAAGAPFIRAGEWASYVNAFVSDEGRVIDIANGNISHSESQGYGLVLAALADDRPTFERIWSFTQTELLVRDDGLAAWRWDPASTPHITDINNATDGDMLIAYGLALAGEAWDAADFTDRARTMVGTIGRSMIIELDGMPAILPGAEGFVERAAGDGPVVNPSYWIFETMPVFAELDPDTDWSAISDSGVEIVRRARITRTGLPPDWTRLDDDGAVLPAADFPPEFGYNGIRVPLYMMRAGIKTSLLDPFRDHADEQGLQRVDVLTGAVLETIGEPGYRLVAAAMECVATGASVPEDLTEMAATSYYGATLQLLALDFLRREHPDCVGESAP